MTRAAPCCFYSSMLPLPSRTRLMAEALVSSRLHVICLLTSHAMFYHRLPCSSHSYSSGLFLLQERTVHVLASGPLNLFFSWLETLPPMVIPVHSVPFSGSSIASLSNPDSLYPTLYFFSAFISNRQTLWLYIVGLFFLLSIIQAHENRNLAYFFTVVYFRLKTVPKTYRPSINIQCMNK